MRQSLPTAPEKGVDEQKLVSAWTGRSVIGKTEKPRVCGAFLRWLSQEPIGV